MKRKIATLVTLALSATLLLGGCGGNADAGTANTTNNELSKSTNKKSGAMSEVLSKGKVIGYVVETVDKEETPASIFFFNDGKLTVIPGDEFGLTMGDFAQMKDDEIWKELEDVKTSYAKNYVSKEMKKKLKREACKEAGFSDMDDKDYDSFQEIYDGIENGTLTEDMEDKIFSAYCNYCIKNEMHGLTNIYRFQDEDVELTDEVIAEADAEIANVEAEAAKLKEEFLTKGQLYTEAVEYWKEIAEPVIQKKEELSYKGPFFELPFVFAVETDSSGNNVQSESIVYPTLKDSYNSDAISEYYYEKKFTAVSASQQDIYETTYNCLKQENGYNFLTREAMDTDTLDSGNVKVDLTEDEKDELFKSEVMSRYE